MNNIYNKKLLLHLFHYPLHYTLIYQVKGQFANDERLFYL